MHMYIMLELLMRRIKPTPRHSLPASILCVRVCSRTFYLDGCVRKGPGMCFDEMSKAADAFICIHEMCAAVCLCV